MVESEQDYTSTALGWWDNGEPTKSIERCTEGIVHYPDSTELYRLRAIAYEAVQKIDEAIRDMTSYITLAPQDSGGYFYRAAMYRALGDYSKAIDDYTVSIGLSPLAVSYFRRGLTRYENGDMVDAASDLQKAIELEDDENSDVVTVSQQLLADILPNN